MAKHNLKIALVGMYGGMWREYNPGCFLLGYKTVLEIKKRLPAAKIDVYAIDNKAGSQYFQKSNKYNFTLNFFGRHQERRLLERILSRYDALIFGGDIIWGGDDVVKDNKIFFLQSPIFLKTQKPTVLFNSVHTFYDSKSIIENKNKFIQAAARAQYVSVRTGAIVKKLRSIGIKKATFVPDPVLDLDMAPLNNGKSLGVLKKPSFPVLGISIRHRLTDELAYFLKNSDLSAWQVFLFPYSRQYGNLQTVLEIEKEFGDKFTYFKKYLNPIDSYRLIGQLDCYITDTYHGAIAATIHGIPFISIDVETEKTSRKQQLLHCLKIPQTNNIRIAYKDPSNFATLTKSIEKLLKQPLSYDKKAFLEARQKIQGHFDQMAEIIRLSTKLK